MEVYCGQKSIYCNRTNFQICYRVFAIHLASLPSFVIKFLQSSFCNRVFYNQVFAIDFLQLSFCSWVFAVEFLQSSFCSRVFAIKFLQSSFCNQVFAIEFFLQSSFCSWSCIIIVEHHFLFSPHPYSVQVPVPIHVHGSKVKKWQLHAGPIKLQLY